MILIIPYRHYYRVGGPPKSQHSRTLFCLLAVMPSVRGVTGPLQNMVVSMNKGILI